MFCKLFVASIAVTASSDAPARQINTSADAGLYSLRTSGAVAVVQRQVPMRILWASVQHCHDQASGHGSFRLRVSPEARCQAPKLVVRLSGAALAIAYESGHAGQHAPHRCGGTPGAGAGSEYLYTYRVPIAGKYHAELLMLYCNLNITSTSSMATACLEDLGQGALNQPYVWSASAGTAIAPGFWENVSPDVGMLRTRYQRNRGSVCAVGVTTQQAQCCQYGGEHPALDDFPTAWSSDAELNIYQQKLSVACGFEVELARAFGGNPPGVRLPEERSYVWRPWVPGPTSGDRGGDDHGALQPVPLCPGRNVCLVGSSHSHYLSEYFASLLSAPQTHYIEAKFPREFAHMLRVCQWGQGTMLGTSSLPVCAEVERCQVFVLGMTQWPSAYTSVLPWSERYNSNPWWSRDINRNHPITPSEIEASVASPLPLRICSRTRYYASTDACSCDVMTLSHSKGRLRGALSVIVIRRPADNLLRT